MKVKSAVEIYKEVLAGKRRRFPNNFWKYGETFNYSNAKEVTIYMIENVLNWSEADVKKKLSHETFKENELGGMLQAGFKGSTYKALNNAYPGKYYEWELGVTPHNYWNLETAKTATMWLIEEKLKWGENEVKEKLCTKIFIENGLYGMLISIFNGSVYKALNNAYPGKYHEWELGAVSHNYWNLETAKKATIWMIEKKLKWSEDEAREKLCYKTFIENGLGGMLQAVFKGRVSAALENAYRK